MESPKNPDISLRRTSFEENAQTIEGKSKKNIADLSSEELQDLATAKKENDGIIDESYDEATAINEEKKKESIESQSGEVEREKEKLLQNLETLKQNTAAVEKSDADKNELPLKVLGAKVRDICSNFLDKLQKMDTADIAVYAMLGSIVAGVAVAGINLAGLEDKFHFASYLPDAMKNFEIAHGRNYEEVNGFIGTPGFDKPLDRGAWNFMDITLAGSTIGTGIGTILKKISSLKTNSAK